MRKWFVQLKKWFQQKWLTEDDPTTANDSFGNLEAELNLAVSPRPAIKTIRTYGIIIILVFFGGLGLWSILSEIESAAIAPGEIVVAGNRRVVQHLEGGIITAIYVKNGMIVKKGQELLKIDDTQAAAKFAAERDQMLRLLADEARILALLDESSQITFPSRLLQEQSPEIKNLIANQQSSFAADRATATAELKILTQRILELKEQVKGVTAQLDSSTQQLVLIKEELSAMLILAKDQLVDRSRILSLQREQARLEGSRGEYVASISSLKEKIGAAELSFISAKDKLNKEWNEKLREIREKLALVKEREKSTGDIFTRTSVTSPADGTIVNLNVFTLGAVVKPGETLLEIVPQHEELVVEAKLNIHDIDVVHRGLKAKISLSALKTRTTPLLQGIVDYVAADTTFDEKTQTHYYVVRVQIERQELKKLGGKELFPGMPAEVMIITHRATPFEYFMDPIQRSIRRSFKDE